MDGCRAPKGLGAPKGTVCHGVKADAIHRQLQRLEPANMLTESIHATGGGIEAMRCCRRRCRFITIYFSYAPASCFFRSSVTIPGESTREVNPLHCYVPYIGSFDVSSSPLGACHRHRRQIFIHVYIDVYICMYQICLIGLCQGSFRSTHRTTRRRLFKSHRPPVRTHTRRNLLLWEFLR